MPSLAAATQPGIALFKETAEAIETVGTIWAIKAAETIKKKLL